MVTAGWCVADIKKKKKTLGTESLRKFSKKLDEFRRKTCYFPSAGKNLKNLEYFRKIKTILLRKILST